MSETKPKYGILVGVDGSPASDAAVAWASREAVSRQLPITLIHVVAPIVVGSPADQLYATMPEWQEDNAQHVIERSWKTFTASLDESTAPEVHIELVYSSTVPTLIEASKEAPMLVVGS
jgi:nucleotide-binding universal stress UspA family protein